MVLAPLETAWMIPAAIAVCGIVFLGDAAAEGGARSHGVATFLLNFISLPIGGGTFFLGALDAYGQGGLTVATGAAMGAGAILIGRSLREIPWTAAVSLAAAAAAGWLLLTHFPSAPTLPFVLGGSAVVFGLVFGVLYLIELPFRLAGLIALPRPFLVALGAGCLVIATYLGWPLLG